MTGQYQISKTSYVRDVVNARRSPTRILGRAFYRRHPAKVARDLIGKILVRRIGRVLLAGRIVETEAYSSGDPASHAYRGLTPRNRALFGDVGHAYIYQTHGQFCLNVVAKAGQPAGGVLLRALEPGRGIGLMKRLRRGGDARRLTKGPGNLARAFGIDLRLYGADVTKPGPLFIAAGGAVKPKVLRTPRIGVTSAKEVRWRFVPAAASGRTSPAAGRGSGQTRQRGRNRT